MVKTQVRAHYVIGRDGQVYHMLNDYLRAWHGGVARWGNTTDINSSSIGIELDNNGLEPFSGATGGQPASKCWRGLKKTYGIPTANFIGHADIAPGRKTDPSVLFPWKRLAREGFTACGTMPGRCPALPAPDSAVAVAMRLLAPRLARPEDTPPTEAQRRYMR